MNSANNQPDAQEDTGGDSAPPSGCSNECSSSLCVDLYEAIQADSSSAKKFYDGFIVPAQLDISSELRRYGSYLVAFLGSASFVSFVGGAFSSEFGMVSFFAGNILALAMLGLLIFFVAAYLFRSFNAIVKLGSYRKNWQNTLCYDCWREEMAKSYSAAMDVSISRLKLILIVLGGFLSACVALPLAYVAGHYQIIDKFKSEVSSVYPGSAASPGAETSDGAADKIEGDNQ